MTTVNITEPGQGVQQDTFTVEYVVQSHVTVDLTFDQARELFGLGGTADEDLGRRIEAIAQHSPAVLSKLRPHAAKAFAYSWTLQKINDPWGDI